MKSGKFWIVTRWFRKECRVEVVSTEKMVDL